MGKITSNKGIELIKKFEGCRLAAYKCPAGVWTIGYGHTANVTSGMAITQQQADNYLREDLARFEKCISDNVKVSINQNQFDALVSFTYNCGAGAFKNSTLLKMLNQGNYKEAAEQLLRWDKANGKVLAGLTRRRKEERELFLSELSSEEPGQVITVKHNFPVLRKGTNNFYVKILQLLLLDKGIEVGVAGADGKFGIDTCEAVMDYQVRSDLEKDGIVGKKTWGMLLT